MLYNETKIKHYDLAVVGNSLAAVLTAKRVADLGKKVALVTPSEQLMSEFSETKLGYIPAHNPLLPALSELGAEPEAICGEYCLPAGMASKVALGALRDSGVNIYLKAAPIGLLKSGEGVKGVAVATKFGAYAIKSSAVADFSGGEYICPKPQKEREYLFSMRLKDAAENLPNQRIPQCGDAYDIEIHKDIYDSTAYGVVFKSRTSAEGVTQRLALTAAELCGYIRHNISGFSEAAMFRCALKALPTEAHKTKPYPGFISIETGDIRNTDLTEVINEVVEFSKAYEFSEPDTLSTAFGDFPLKDLYTGNELDEFLGAEIPEIKIPHDNIPTVTADLFIAGLGAGGIAALTGAKKSGCSIVAAEAMPTPGGTRTHGMVSAFWHGYQGGFATKKVKSFLGATEKQLGKAAWQNVKEAIYDLKIAASHKVFYSSIVFDAVKSGSDTCGALLATEKGIVKVVANKCIDATGDADLARLSGVEYMESGDHRDFVTQGYSIWGLEKSGTPFADSVHKNDDDSISTEKYSEYLRGTFITQSGNSDYDFSPLLTVRESRRIKGKYTLNMGDILSGKSFEDTVAVSLCLYDAHGMGSSPAYYTSIFKGIRGKGTPEVLTRIPLRALLPETDEGLMVISKAISGTRDAVCLVRMNPDIMNTGFAAGVIGGNAAKNNLPFETAYTEEIKALFEDMELLPENLLQPTSHTAAELLESVKEGNPQSMIAATAHPEFLEEFEKGFQGEKPLALVIAALGSHKAFAPLLESLKEELSQYDNTPSAAERLSTLAVLLSRLAAQSDPERGELLPHLKRVIELMEAGGGYGDPARGIYQNSKVHNRVVPNFKAIMGAAIAAETLPDESLIEPLRSLKEKKNISLRDGAEIHSVQLYLRILAAAARCGDREALEEIKTYRDSERYFFRRFAEAENTKNINAVNPRIPDPFWI